MFIVLLLWVRCVFYNTSRPVKLHYYSVGHRCFDHRLVSSAFLLSLSIQEIKSSGGWHIKNRLDILGYAEQKVN